MKVIKRKTLAIGSKVSLNSGSVAMTVINISEDNMVTCYWWDKTHFNQIVVPIAALLN